MQMSCKCVTIIIIIVYFLFRSVFFFGLKLKKLGGFVCVFVIKLNDFFFNVLFSPNLLPFSSLSIWRTFVFQDEEYYYHIGTCDFFLKFGEKYFVCKSLLYPLFGVFFLIGFQ